ncbi:hypothetical protein CANMA_004047 [Candida margitis]|uniref:uncharacterized protein n=1 Tax=Candida margitis TaxID=1775924 RepID=UPI0022265B00|nr:uncharacterized protein CANMA_004047 [Candida margitis]KAI5960267.1 hypothetical protein CANMA_004047 [Candida margitis]
MSNSQTQKNCNKTTDKPSAIINYSTTVNKNTQSLQSKPNSTETAMLTQTQTTFTAQNQEFPQHFNSSINFLPQSLQLQSLGMGLASLQHPELQQLSMQHLPPVHHEFAMTNENLNQIQRPTTQVFGTCVYNLSANASQLAQDVNNIQSFNQSISHHASLGSITQPKAQEIPKRQSMPSLRPMYLPQFGSSVQSVSQIQQMAALQPFEPPYLSSTLNVPEVIDSTFPQSTNASLAQSQAAAAVDVPLWSTGLPPNEYPSESSSASPVSAPPTRGKRYRKHSSSQQHEMTPETALRNRCRICNKQFKRPSSLQTHYYSHTGEKTFQCPWQGCGKMFSVKSNMTRHYRLHERDSRRAQELDFQSKNPELMRALGLSSNSSAVRQYFQTTVHPHQSGQSQQLLPQLQHEAAAALGAVQAHPRELNQLDTLQRPHYQSFSPLSTQISPLVQSQFIPNPLISETNVPTDQVKVPEIQQSPIQTLNSRFS